MARDEVFVKINGERHYLWRAVDHEGEVSRKCHQKERQKSSSQVHGKPCGAMDHQVRSSQIPAAKNWAVRKSTKHGQTTDENSHFPFDDEKKTDDFAMQSTEVRLNPCLVSQTLRTTKVTRKRSHHTLDKCPLAHFSVVVEIATLHDVAR